MKKLQKLGIAAVLMMLLTAFLTVPSSAITHLSGETMSTLERVLPVVILPVTTCLMAAMFVHAGYLLGWKNAAKFFGYGYVIAWIFEDISVHTGWIFGLYRFPAMMGPKLDVIPFEIPMFWVMCFYIAWYTTNLILDRSPIPTNWSTARILIGSIIGGGILTTLDLTTDPFATANGFWIWPNGGTFFNEPVHNFVGWWVTGAITYMIHGFILRKDTEEEPIVLNTKAKRIWTIALVAVYAVYAVGFTSMNVHGSLGVPTALAMGVPALVALWNWYNWYTGKNRDVEADYVRPDGYAYVFEPEFSKEPEDAE